MRTAQTARPYVQLVLPHAVERYDRDDVQRQEREPLHELEVRAGYL